MLNTTAPGVSGRCGLVGRTVLRGGLYQPVSAAYDGIEVPTESTRLPNRFSREDAP